MHADNLRAAQGVWQADHHVYCLRPSDTNAKHGHPGSIWCVRVRADQQGSWLSIAFEDDLVQTGSIVMVSI